MKLENNHEILIFLWCFSNLKYLFALIERRCGVLAQSLEFRRKSQLLERRSQIRRFQASGRAHRRWPLCRRIRMGWSNHRHGRFYTRRSRSWRSWWRRRAAARRVIRIVGPVLGGGAVAASCGTCNDEQRLQFSCSRIKWSRTRNWRSSRCGRNGFIGKARRVFSRSRNVRNLLAHFRRLNSCFELLMELFIVLELLRKQLWLAEIRESEAAKLLSQPLDFRKRRLGRELQRGRFWAWRQTRRI